MASRIAARNALQLKRAKIECDGMLDQLRRAQTDEHEKVMRLDAELKKKEVEVELKGEVVELKVEVAELKEGMKKKDVDVAELKERMNKKDDEAAELKKDVNRLEAIIMRIVNTMA